MNGVKGGLGELGVKCVVGERREVLEKLERAGDRNGKRKRVAEGGTEGLR